ncbi:DHA2 family efflux MFS transporter permease subunit [Brevibacillus choshinensis]|uniref:DHA2 family efflux MFS transporter permease subunit n=1 Tax=Brevibacillus choshinensis TaxID=54911 RepID=UPI002E1A628F|nr:DHA2 family efflux MFS transporter permease subunit [Brevibacillus choshinensis]MED4583898.1 DHA2 family efflux MFS transporter permease subunit [Brevibacillus choshinensis]MED4783841.1 DHA2 family efflux MFS transporter permease subunit [Brevibacillus choshinensis]
MNPQENFWPGVFAIVLGTFMAVLDTSIVNVAIPEMMHVFGASTEEIQWVVTSYTLTMAAVIPLAGYVGIRFGIKKSYLVSLLLFTVGSLLCGLAWSNGSMIVARIIQAAGGGLMMTIGQSMIQLVVPREKMGPAMGVFGISVFVAPAVGPTLSGYFVQHMDWRFIFTVNIPFGIVAMMLVWRFLREGEVKKEHPFDLAGFIWSATALVSLLLAVTKGEEKGWDSFFIVSLFLTALISGAMFVARELSTGQPLVDIRLLANRDFTLGLLVNSMIMVGNFGVIYLLPIYSENMLGKTAMDTGLLMLPQAIASGIVTPISGMLAARVGLKPMIVVGLIFCLVPGFLISHVDLDTDVSTLHWLLAVRGIGLGMCLMTSMQIPLLAVSDPARVPAASVITNISRQVATSIGIASLISLFSRRSIEHAVHASEQVTATQPPVMTALEQWQQMYVAKGLSVQEAAASALQLMGQLVKKYAAIQALQDSLLMAALILVVALLIMLIVKENKAALQPSKEQPSQPAMLE